MHLYINKDGECFVKKRCFAECGNKAPSIIITAIVQGFGLKNQKTAFNHTILAYMPLLQLSCVAH